MWIRRVCLGFVLVLGCWLVSGVWGGCAQAPEKKNENLSSGEGDRTELASEVQGKESQRESGTTDATEAGKEVTPEPVVEKKPPAAPYRIKLFENIRLNSRAEYNGKKYEHVRNALVDIELKDESFAKVELVVELRSTCYPFSQWASDPRPPGHNWPPNCDAFDRNFEFIMDPPGKTGGPPAIELVRAITPFGGPMDFKVDVTDVANVRRGKHAIRVNISTFADGKGRVSGANGGWFVTAYLQVTPGQPIRKVLAVIPLFNHIYRHNDNKRLEAKFTLPEGTKRTVLEYRVTGHGGAALDRPACIGGADEFCKRVHHLFADGKEAQKFTPWRSDCANFCTLIQTQFGQRCKENPNGALRSVRAPRANWCPGSITWPIKRSLPAFQSPGKHTFGYQIDKVAKGGSWRVSAVLIAYGE